MGRGKEGVSISERVDQVLEWDFERLHSHHKYPRCRTTMNELYSCLMDPPDLATISTGVQCLYC